jgi:hypothetical protein
MAVRQRLPRPDPSRWRIPSRFTLACLALCALIAVGATADLLRTESRLPDVSVPPCDKESPGCRETELTEELERLRAAEPLQDQYDSRAWLYSSAILAIAAVATAYSLRLRRPRPAWPQVFTNLGVAGVWLGLAAVVLLVATGGGAIAPPPAPTMLLPVALLVAAATGTLIGRSEEWAAQAQGNGVREMVVQAGKLAIHVGTAGQLRRSRLERLAGWLTLVALALTGLTWLLALVSLLGEPDCAAEGTPGWADPLDALAAITAIGGMTAGLGALVLRRWIAALVSLAACPLAVLVVLASTCAFY